MHTTEAMAAVTPAMGEAWNLQRIALDEPRGDEIIVRIVATGICHTDVAVRDQHLPVPLPAVLGHEGAGIVEKVGPAVTQLIPGDHVVLTILHCGKCSNCLHGHPAYCDNLMPLNFAGTRADGSAPLTCREEKISGMFFGQSSFATYALATERNAVKVPKDIDLALLGPLGCGIQTGAGTVMNVLKPAVGSSIAIFGVGPVGMAAIMAAKVVGCITIIAIDIHENRLAMAQELGATHVVDGSKGDAVEAIREIGGGVRYSIDTTANTAVIRQAVESLVMRGEAVLVGVSPPGAEITLSVTSLLFGQSIRGVVEGDTVPQDFITSLIELWRQGRFPFDRMIRFYDFTEINEAVADSLNGTTMKPVLRIGQVAQ